MNTRKLSEVVADMSDSDVWELATFAVGAAGIRASLRGFATVNTACVEFIQIMHEEVGTAPPPKVMT